MVAILSFQTLALAGSQAAKSTQPAWKREFPEGDVWVINTNVGTERGRPVDKEKGEERSIYSVDSLHGVLLVMAGDPERSANLYGINAETGEVDWKKESIQLNRSRPLRDYAYYDTTAQSPLRLYDRVGKSYVGYVMGGLVLLSIVNGKRAGVGNCTDQPEVVALDITDGLLVWCNHEVAEGELTLIPVPEKQMLVMWDVNAESSLPLYALDLKTGETKWKVSLGISKARNWTGFLRKFTPVGQPAALSSSLYDGNDILLHIAEATTFSLPKEVTLRKHSLETGKLQWAKPIQWRETFGIGMPGLSWNFSDEALILSFWGKEVIALDRSTGTTLWQTKGLKGNYKMDQIKKGDRSLILLRPVKAFVPKEPMMESDGFYVLDAKSVF